MKNIKLFFSVLLFLLVSVKIHPIWKGKLLRTFDGVIILPRAKSKRNVLPSRWIFQYSVIILYLNFYLYDSLKFINIGFQVS